MSLQLYWLFWKKQALFSLQTLLVTKWGSLIFILGKFVRYFFFLTVIIRVGEQTKLVAGYSIDQLITFFLIYNMIDLLGQLFFRGVYFFRDLIVDGTFDFVLLKPLNPLFQVLTGYIDMLDIPLLLVVLVSLLIQNLHASFMTIVLYLIAIGISLLVLVAFHILVVAFGIIFFEVDSIVMLFRDLSRMGQLPVDIYQSAVRFVITYIIPIAIIMNLPAKALLNLISWQNLVLSLGIAIVVLILSLWFWQQALKQYSSASS
ncbi:hypothetical protein GYA49_02880 [Candidatus Beckwithbacteria bacterium]|nr:hypothetical protein [Candidatus Beckwithbacteria bacterium]